MQGARSCLLFDTTKVIYLKQLNNTKNNHLAKYKLSTFNGAPHFALYFVFT